jgi:hypothetical protein
LVLKWIRDVGAEIVSQWAQARRGLLAVNSTRRDDELGAPQLRSSNRERRRGHARLIARTGEKPRG